MSEPNDSTVNPEAELPTKRPTGRPSKASLKAERIKKVQSAISELEEEERQDLERMGCIMPQGNLHAALEKKYKFGLRCAECNQVALYFVGDRWRIGDDEWTDIPPGLPHNQISWTQHLPLAQIDRITPRCQHCKRDVPLNPDGSFSRERQRIIGLDKEGNLITDIESWERSRDQSYDRKTVQALMSSVNKGLAANPVDGTGASHNYNLPDRPVSAVLEEKQPGITREIELVAGRTGVTDALVDARNRGR